VRMHDVSLKQLEKKWPALQLGEIQHLVVDNHGEVAEGDLAPRSRSNWTAPAKRLARILAPISGRTEPRHQLEKHLRQLLFDNVSSAEALKDLCTTLGLDATALGAVQDRVIAIARSLFDISGTQDERFERLGAVCDRLITVLGKDTTQRFIRILTPFCWVAPDLAIALSAHAGGELPRAVGWRHSWPLSEWMHVQRAFCLLDVPIARPSLFTGGGADESIAHVKSCLATALHIGRDASDRQIERQIERRHRDGVPTVLELDYDFVDTQIAKRLAALSYWDRLLAFVHRRDMTKAQFDRLGWPHGSWVKPELDGDHEDDARADFGYLMGRAGATEKDIERIARLI